MEKKEDEAQSQSNVPAPPPVPPPAPPAEQPKTEEVKTFEEGQSISGLVREDLVKELMEMGFAKVLCEKALYLTGNSSADKAVDWIEKHQQDKDFLEELRIVGY